MALSFDSTRGRAGLFSEPFDRSPRMVKSFNPALPPMLASLIRPSGVSVPPATQGSPAAFVRPAAPQSLGPYTTSPVIGGYANGGVVPAPMAGEMQLGVPPSPGGLQQPPASAPAKPLNPTQVQAELQRFIQQHPQQVKQIQEALQSALQSGELSIQELNLAIQLAVAAAQNPAMYPKLRAMAIQKGLGTEQDIPPQYDQGLIFSLILAGQVLQSGGMGLTSGLEPTQPQGAPQQLRDGGGVIPRNKNPHDDVAEGRRDDIKIAVSGGEYVIPAHIVRQKGTDFFDKMIGKNVK